MRVNSAIAMLAVFITASAFTTPPDHDLWAKEVNLVIRQLGHQLLLQSGDSMSRVLPVTEIKEGTFQLSFENDLSFNHDSLIVLSQKLLPKKQFPSGYTVTVHESAKAEIVYGFKVNNTGPDIVACSGRREPRGNYKIEIFFQDLYGSGAPAKADIGLVLSGVLALVVGVTLLFGRFGKKNDAVPVLKKTDPVSDTIGKFSFDVKDQRLSLGDEVIGLTDKECRILELLNKNFGELIPRETLMQKIWINEGVITGRSLDMFVSKLRKKLSADPELRITNIHGKGYKLEIVGV